MVRQPGDGSCLFHSLSYGLGEGNAASLRERVAAYVEASPSTCIGGSAIKDWVQWDSGLTPSAYARRMRGEGQWGGAIEIAITCKLAGVAVHVFEPAGSAGGFRCISTFAPDEDESAGSAAESRASGAGVPGGAAARTRRTVRLLYGGRVHYDALVV